jgi:hypothetical protein
MSRPIWEGTVRSIGYFTDLSLKAKQSWQIRIDQINEFVMVPANGESVNRITFIP